MLHRGDGGRTGRRAHGQNKVRFTHLTKPEAFAPKTRTIGAGAIPEGFRIPRRLLVLLYTPLAWLVHHGCGLPNDPPTHPPTCPPLMTQPPAHPPTPPLMTLLHPPL